MEKACLNVFDRVNKEMTTILVQYNPATLNLRASAGTLRSNSLFQTNPGALADQVKREQAIVLEVSLIFEEIHNDLAFRTSTLLANSTNIAAQASAALKKKFVYKEGSKVRAKTQGIMAILLSGGEVSFFFGPLEFKGSIDEAGIDYTMFDETGEPIFARMDLRIQSTMKQFLAANKEQLAGSNMKEIFDNLKVGIKNLMSKNKES